MGGSSVFVSSEWEAGKDLIRPRASVFNVSRYSRTETTSVPPQIHDGPTMSSPLLAHVCGSTLPPSITSTQNTIYVRFRSDFSLNHRGFSARFSEGGSKMFTNYTQRIKFIMCYMFPTACGATIITDNVGGAIASPRYPSPYPPSQNCSWILKAQEPCELFVKPSCVVYMHVVLLTSDLSFCVQSTTSPCRSLTLR